MQQELLIKEISQKLEEIESFLIIFTCFLLFLRDLDQINLEKQMTIANSTNCYINYILFQFK